MTIEDISALQPDRAISVSPSVPHPESYPDPKITDTRQSTRSNSISHVEEPKQDDDLPVYRLYRRRFTGLLGFVSLDLSPIAAQEFDISISQVNWLGNIISCVFLPVSLLVPVFCTRFGIRRCVPSRPCPLSSAYALLILGQFFSAISQPIFQVLGPKYSEMWFDLKGRTTATMVIAIANPVGGAIGQLLSPLVGTARQSVGSLKLSIVYVLRVARCFLCTPYAGSKAPQSLNSLLRAMIGKVRTGDPAYMTPHERLDFVINTLLFGVLVGAANALSILSAQYFEPEGYSDSISGLLGATLLLSGVFTGIVTAPLFDRVLTHHLGITIKVLVPIAAGAWLSLIWAVKPNNTGGLFAIMVIIGICSLIMLPVGLELAVEVTRNADGSAAILWCTGNALGIIFILAEGALRASATASPPYNMHSAFVLHGVLVAVVSANVVFVRAKQVRREMDERMAQHLHPNHCVEALPMGTLGTAYSNQSIKSIEKESGWIQDKDKDKDNAIPSPEEIEDTRLEVIGTVA
ncbi:major facilitator superfamily domain-containing protein [Suillus bovinus]|uniref:major facilitator superfamily domain-containing protein n=1 Tax=Suillus bovinus TaxID=48563 RepID=UPI001B87738A|nr:major facilitator superfamily domain-containing protein [Suillus bovinus]KAG2145999.1 major facilitator superfamily domain-containing protein [Suillus bovinus]